MDAELHKKVTELVKQIQVTRYTVSREPFELSEPVYDGIDEIVDFIQQEIAKASESAHLTGFKNGKQATLKRVNDIWLQLMIDEVGSEKAFAYRDAIVAELSKPLFVDDADKTLKEHKEP